MQESVPERQGGAVPFAPEIDMGIFDDAIRQHLELKRQRGATESELKQLEDEAFGPPVRPGDAGLPDDSPEQSANGVAPDPAEELTTVYDETADSGQEPDQLEMEPGLAEVEPAEPPPDEPEPAEPPPDEPEPAEPPPDEPEAEDRDPADQPEEAASSAPPPVESLDTVEHEITDEEAEHDDRAAHEPGSEPDPERKAGGADDPLADTPEFLRDAPEDDELWFEQGEPKDFDF